MIEYKTRNKDYKIVAVGDIFIKKIAVSFETARLLRQKEDAVEDVWKEASRKRKLFNGVIFNFCGFDQKNNEVIIKGHFVEYKYFYAQLNSPDIDFGINPLGVSGITLLHEA